MAEQIEISIHALREEGDALNYQRSRAPGVFLSTPSARRATDPKQLTVTFIDISIHALREEGDALGAVRIFIVVLISIHALREEGDLVRYASA